MKFIVPAQGRVTSGFRTKSRPDHNGIDIAQAGLVEIKATASGRVMRSYTSSSYGEVIFVVHNIGGQTWESVYAHMKKGSRKYGVGADVKQGAVLGYMGSTGQSTGQHLHFELHKGNWNATKSNAVDPLAYIGKEDAKPVTQSAGGKKIYLPANATSWTVYKLDRPPVKSNPANIAGTLNPHKFGGLSYTILKDLGGNVYEIQTANFGRVKIFGSPSTGAVVK